MISLIMISPITLISQWLRRQTRQGHQLTERGSVGKIDRKTGTQCYHIQNNKNNSLKIINGLHFLHNTDSNT